MFHPQQSIDAKAVKLHKQWGGKLEVHSRVPLKTREDLSIAYTPGVAEVCRAIVKNPMLARTLTMKKNTVAVITDGSAVLGLGNLGPLAALPVMEGKAILFKELGNVDAFPICLDTQDVEKIIATIKYIAPAFGGINLEDISAPRCFEIEERLKKELSIPVMHDDQHGTAVVVLAGLINALKLKKLNKAHCRVVISGAGAAGTAITKLLLQFGVRHIIVCDRAGILNRTNTALVNHKISLAQMTNHELRRGGISDALCGADVFIGVSGKNLLTPTMIATMNPHPIIFALANPDPEIEPTLAQNSGAYIVATGRSDFPNQLNNVLAFPGIFRGALDHRVTTITNTMLLNAAKKLSAFVVHPTPNHILPDALDKRVVRVVASAIHN